MEARSFELQELSVLAITDIALKTLRRVGKFLKETQYWYNIPNRAIRLNQASFRGSTKDQ